MTRPGPTSAAARRDRYSSVAIGLHWLIAAALLVQLLLGWRLDALDGLARSTMLQVHKVVGLSVLLLTLARLAWRLINPPPPETADLRGAEKRVSRWVHLAFYGALIVLPLTGWAMVSLRRPGGIALFAGLRWPAFPFLAALPGGVQETLSGVMGDTHSVLVWMLVALLGLHLAGAMKHQFISKDSILSRMAPGARPGAMVEPRLIAIPLVMAALAAIVYLPKLKSAPVRPAVTQLAKADLYLDVVGPAIDRRCGACHNDDEARGGLSLVTYDGIRQGGRTGPVVVPGQPGQSELYRRIRLPADHAKFMPRNGRAPLTSAELTAVGYWISQGAPKSVSISRLALTPEASAALRQIVGGTGGDAQPDGSIGPVHGPALPSVAAADPALIAKLVTEGFGARKVDKNSNLLDVDYIDIKPVTETAMADLAKLGPQILRLNLRNARVNDRMVKTVAQFPNLSHLRLESNPISDAAAKDIGGMKALTYLNIVNTKITDAGFAELARAPRLNQIYFWGAPVTPAAAAAARAARKDALLYAGLTAKDVPVETRTVQPVN